MDLGSIVEIAGRVANAEQRLERLEALEFSSVGGGGIFLIERITLAAAVMAITFDNIPDTAHQLWVIWWAECQTDWSTSAIYMQVNNDAGNNYYSYTAWHRWNNLYTNSQIFGGDHAVAGYAASNGQDYPWVGHLLIPCYKCSKKKAWTWDAHGMFVDWPELPVVDHLRVIGGGTWTGTAAINRLDFYRPGVIPLAIGTCFSLYGIG